jgi:hypothetical protein
MYFGFLLSAMSTERTKAQIAPMTSKLSSRWRGLLFIGAVLVWMVVLGVSTWPIKVMSRYGHGWVPTAVMLIGTAIVPILKRQLDTKGMITGVPWVLVNCLIAVGIVFVPISFLIHPLISSLLLMLTVRWSQKKYSQHDATVPAVAERR